MSRLLFLLFAAPLLFDFWLFISTTGRREGLFHGFGFCITAFSLMRQLGIRKLDNLYHKSRLCEAFTFIYLTYTMPDHKPKSRNSVL